MSATILPAAVVAANPGPAVHLAALGILVLVGLAAYTVVRRRREAAEAERQPDAHDASSPNRPSETTEGREE